MDSRIGLAEPGDLDSWMELVQAVRWNFPGLETDGELEEYRNTVIKNIKRGSAVCAKDQGTVVGVLLFSTKYNMLCCMAVHPDYRRKGIATEMIRLMLSKLDSSRDITVTTFREGDDKGTAPRALYRSLGFEPAELCYDQGYPVQKFLRRAAKKAEN